MNTQFLLVLVCHKKAGSPVSLQLCALCGTERLHSDSRRCLVKPIVIGCKKKTYKKTNKKISKNNKRINKKSNKNKKQNCTDAWVTRPERLKGVKDVIKQARRAAA